MSSRNYNRGSGKYSKFKKGKGQFDPKEKFGDKRKRWEIEDEEIDRVKALYDEVDAASLEAFQDFPLSSKTQKGLSAAKYEKSTDIQREAICLALQGNDILGAAKTGSGKTLAFLIPVLECLFRLKWSSADGLGALIISPTRELAYQTFEVLRKIGKFHDFSAGLVIGGKHLRKEAESINRTNIVICTPGRLLQHMDETAYFNADNLHMLVLDEADRILDLGFQQSMNAIIENLPPDRQTLLFSATQTKSVKDLARLSLKDPMYVSVHEHSRHSTPSGLQQSYMVCELHDKMSLLWSFIKNHLQTKILVFMSSCKQVRFIHDALRHLRPGVTVLCLHGAMQQLKRVATYEQFCRKQHAVLLATDIAARGLDFPAVNWVVQLDCPEDANTYIHRAGRTARYEKDGEALLVLTPSEQEGMVQELDDRKIPINSIKVNPKKLWSIQGKLESLLASDVTLKEFAQRAFTSYIKSVYLMGNKKIFDVHKLDTDKYAVSLGLAIPPRVRFLQKQQKCLIEKEKQKQLAAEVHQIFAKSPAVSLPSELSESPSKHKQSKDVESGGSDSGLQSDSEKDDSGSDSEIMSTVKTQSFKSNIDQSRTGGSESSSEEEEENPSESESDSDVGEKELDKLKKDGESLNFGVDEDDQEDLLTVKKTETCLESEESSEEEQVELEQNNDKEKKLSKFALAKKLQKKNIMVNTKVTFDEEGEVVHDVLRKPQEFECVEEDEVLESGGINIDAARRRLRREDEIDKQIFRDRIKQKHREARFKKKAERRQRHQPQDEEDDEAVLDVGESGSFDPDMLPDPDKLYGSDNEQDSDQDSDMPPSKKQRLSEEENSSGSEENSSGSEEEASSGEEMESAEEEGEEAATSDGEKDNQLGIAMSLKDEEDLALKLLG